MKTTIIAVVTLATLHTLSAQERLPRDEALKYVKAVSAAAKPAQSAPLATNLDLQQPLALQDGDYGGLLLPQKNLTTASLVPTAAGAVAPIGQLWLHKLTPMRSGAAVPAERLRLITVSVDGDEASVPECALGVRRTSGGALELAIFGKGSEPIVVAPLHAIDTKQEAPIELTAERGSESGRVTMKILGKYQASFEVTELEL